MITRGVASSSQSNETARYLSSVPSHSAPARAEATRRADAWAAWRAAASAWLGFGAGVLAMAAIDEGNVSWAVRIGRAFPLTPLCAALGVWFALSQERAWTEGTDGTRSPARRMTVQATGWIVAGASSVALVCGAIVCGWPSVDLESYFPTVTHAPAWQWHDGTFENATDGLRLGSDGNLLPLSVAAGRGPVSAIPPHSRLAAGTETAIMGLAVGLLAARMMVGSGSALHGRGPGPNALRRNALDLGTLAGAIVVTVVLFQLSAAHRIAVLWDVAPPLALLAFAFGRHSRRGHDHDARSGT
jgi:hypothetical protein